jgi:hypothetical protein
MPAVERHALGPGLRVVVGLTGFLIAAATGLFILEAPWSAPHADDIGALVLLAAFGTIGLLFLFVSLVGHTPRWLPVSAPINWPEVLKGLLLMIAIVAIDVLATVLRTPFGLPRVVSTIIAIALLAAPYTALRSYVERARGARTTGPRPDA